MHSRARVRADRRISFALVAGMALVAAGWPAAGAARIGAGGHPLRGREHLGGQRVGGGLGRDRCWHQDADRALERPDVAAGARAGWRSELQRLTAVTARSASSTWAVGWTGRLNNRTLALRLADGR